MSDITTLIKNIAKQLLQNHTRQETIKLTLQKLQTEYTELTKNYKKNTLENKITKIVNNIIKINNEKQTILTKQKIDTIKQTNSTISIQELNKQIKRKGVYTVSPQFTARTGIVDTTKLRNDYYKLIGEKTLKNDKTLMDDIIKNRKTILQKRITCTAHFYTKNSPIASIKIFETLIEHGQTIVDYWTGLTIDPTSFNTLVNQFRNEMKPLGVSNVITVQHPLKKETIQVTTTTFTFA